MTPEFIIQQAVVRGFRRFREDQRYVDTLFHNLHQRDLEALRKFFRNDTVDFSINYPEQDLKLPALVLLMKNENESQAFLGNLMQDELGIKTMGEPFPADELSGSATVLGAGSASPTGLGRALQLQPTTVIEAGANYVYLPAGTFRIFDPFEEDTTIVVLEGTGAGQERQVISIEPRSTGVLLTVAPNWDTTPNTSSVVKLVGPNDGDSVLGEPSKLFTTSDSLERRGSLYKASYHLMVLSPASILTVCLYSAVKAMLFMEDQFLIKQGVMNLQISGTDFVPRAEFLPANCFQRIMSLEFDYSFDVIVPNEEPAASQLQVVVSTQDPVGDPNGLESVGLSTIIDLVS